MRSAILFFFLSFYFVPRFLFAQGVEIDNLRPPQIWDLVIKHYDPENKWEQASGSLHAISIQPNGELISEDIIFNNKYDYYQSFLFHGDTIVMRRKQGKHVRHSVNDKVNLSSEERDRWELSRENIDFLKRRHLFEIGLPMYLKAAEIEFKPTIKEGKFNGRDCLILESIGTISKNRKLFPFIQQSIFYFINPSDFSLLGMEFPQIISEYDIPGYTIIFNGEIYLNGIIVPQVKKYYNHQDNTYSHTTTLHPFTLSEYIDREAEEKAINNLVEGSVNYFQMRNFNSWASGWSQRNDVYHSYVSQKGYMINEGWEKVSKYAQEFMQDNLDPYLLTIEPTNFTYHIYDNIAWVYFDSQLGSQMQGRHQKILRKENGKWKIFNWTIYDEPSYQNN